VKEKLTSLEAAISEIPSGSGIAVGGSILRRQPNAAIRELIRQGKDGLTIYSFPSSTGLDMLAAAGAVKRYEGIYVGLFWHGLAQSFRRGAESGQFEVRDFSESAMVARFRAAAQGASFMPVKAMLGTDMARADPSVVLEMACPFTGEPYNAVRAVSADFAIVHGHTADKYGNVQRPRVHDSDDVDNLIARSGKKLIVTVETIVEHSEIRREPNRTYIPGQWVHAVVEAPFGAHPTACDGCYDEDDDHLKIYAAASRTSEGARGYLDSYVCAGPSENAYIARLGGLEALSRLNVKGG
jgi:glutaconate CoA-transferase subunit A